MAPADHLTPSQRPPGGIAPTAAPQFVSLGFDDNDATAGLPWALQMLAARGVYASFFLIAEAGRQSDVAALWRRAHAEGHELGNHSLTHLPARDGRRRSSDAWRAEIAAATLALRQVVPAAPVRGFRAPYLAYNDAALEAVAALGLGYDCSIEEGFEPGQDGSNGFWPYTLDEGSPGHSAQTRAGLAEIAAHPGLWELPVSALFVPPDDRCAAYGVPSGLRTRCQQRQCWFDPTAGAITGFDYNLWARRENGGFELTRAESAAVLCYTFDQHHRGNRAPLLLGAHAHHFVDDWNESAPGIPEAADRRAVIEEFLDHVRAQAETRVTTHAEVLAWMRAPRDRRGA